MSSERPPTIDLPAAFRWAARAQDGSAWLHEEVGRRMEERLQWIKLQPQAWADWEPVRGGLAAHAAVARRYPKAQCLVVEATPQRAQVAARVLRKPWWARAHWAGPAARFEMPSDGAVQMVWANMLLHMSADPQTLIAQWHRALGPDGFLMFSCLGPDTLRELRDLYRTLDWPPPAHEFTDMHDWGDMLVNAGFAEPVMDMERITLTFDAPERLLLELRQLGRNLHPGRFSGLRGKKWHAQLKQAWLQLEPLVSPPQQRPLTFEIIYGHALKPQPRLMVQRETILSLDQMRNELRREKSAPNTRP
jgi:malonyl-CoA O-methyltransferase